MVPCLPGSVRNSSTNRCRKRKRSRKPKSPRRINVKSKPTQEENRRSKSLAKKKSTIKKKLKVVSTELQKERRESKGEVIENNLIPPVVQLNCFDFGPSKPTLREHQKKVCNWMVGHPSQKGMLLFHSTGSGKTMSALAIVRCLKTLESNERAPVFFVSTKSALPNFKKECGLLGIDCTRYKFMTHDEFAKKSGETKGCIARGAIVVIDEAHVFTTDAIRRPTSKKSPTGNKRKVEKVMMSTSVAKHVFLLTATPVKNFPKEFTNLYAMISNGEKKLADIRRVFEDPTETKRQASRMLTGKISYFQSTRDDFPEVEQHDQPIYMSKDYLRLYERVEKQELKRSDNTVFDATKNLAAFYNGVRRACNRLTEEEDLPNPKIEWLREMVEKVVEKKKMKVVIFSTYIESGIASVQTMLTDSDVPFVTITGKSSAKERAAAVASYNGTEKGKYKDNDVNVMLISDAGAEGIDLKNTRFVVIMEPQWNNESVKQVIGRAARYKSHQYLPLADRKVEVVSLRLHKHRGDEKKMYSKGGEMMSADDILYSIAAAKEIAITDFYNVLIENAIV
jgi:SNF2 family DNA or RNA helicase